MVSWESWNDQVGKEGINGLRDEKANKLNIQRGTRVIQGNFRTWIRKDHKSDVKVSSD